MDWWGEDNWYAVHTKPCQEELAAMHIRRLGLEVILPQTRRKAVVWGASKETIRPLFPCYLFARFCPARYLRLIRYVRGARAVVSSGGVPLPIDEEIIGSIRSRLGEDGYVRITAEPLRVGDRVRVSGGPLEGLVGIYERELSDSRRVTILLQAIEYQARLTIEKQYLVARAASA